MPVPHTGADQGPGVAGLRCGGLVALTARRVDLRRRRIDVVEAITEFHGRVIIGTTKTISIGRYRYPLPGRRIGGPAGREGAGRSPIHRSLGRRLTQHGLPTAVLRPGRGDGRAAWADAGRAAAHRGQLAIATGANLTVVQQMLGHAAQP
jgi:hypothetical protein